MTVDDAMRAARTWWGSLGRPRRIMLSAVTLLFLSQFLPSGHLRRYFLTNATDLTRYTGMGSVTETVDGWTLHPHALPIIGLLVAGFATALADRSAYRRWAYWAGAAGVFAAIVPSAPVATVGGTLGLVALGLAIWAARTARKTPAG